MQKTQKVQAQRWSQTGQHHCAENQTVLICLMICAQVQQIEEFDPKNCTVRAIAQVKQCEHREDLNRSKVVAQQRQNICEN